MGKKAILFAGQGMQQAGMAKDFYKTFPEIQAFYDAIDIRFSVKEFSFEKSLEELSRTRYTQAVIIAFQIAVSKLLESQVTFDYTAGLSIGEYAALYYAGVLNEKDVLKIADYRAEYMEESAKEIDSAMFAVMKTDRAVIEAVCREVSGKSKVEISNINSPVQIVISGERKACEQAVEKLRAQGCRKIVPLNVSGPFHTSYMDNAARQLEQLFQEVTFHDEKVPVVYNVTGKTKQPMENTMDLMCRQVKRPVQFCDSIRYMIDHGVDTFVEVGFQNVLKGLIRKIDPSVKVIPIYSVETLEEAMKEWKK